MFTNSKLAKSVKLACAFSAASAFSFSGAVHAQEEQEAVAVEKIEAKILKPVLHLPRIILVLLPFLTSKHLLHLLLIQVESEG